MSAGPVRALAAYAIARGVPLSALAEATGLAPSAFISPAERFEQEVIVGISQVMRDRFPGEALGLQVAQAAPLEMLGPLRQLATLPPDLGSGIRAFITHAKALSTSISMVLETVPDGTRLRMNHPLDELDGGIGGELGVAMMVRIVREVTGFPEAILRVELAHGPLGPPQAYAAFFEVPHRFRAGHNGIVLHDSALHVAIEPGAIARFRASRVHLAATYQGLVSTPREPHAMRELRATVARQAASGIYDTRRLARALGMSVRTLQRRAAVLGVSVRELMDEVRRTNARRLLADPQLELHEVATLLGYSAEPAFRRAFKRWEGTSPGHYRRQVLTP